MRTKTKHTPVPIEHARGAVRLLGEASTALARYREHLNACGVWRPTIADLDMHSFLLDLDEEDLILTTTPDDAMAHLIAHGVGAPEDDPGGYAWQVFVDSARDIIEQAGLSQPRPDLADPDGPDAVPGAQTSGAVHTA